MIYLEITNSILKLLMLGTSIIALKRFLELKKKINVDYLFILAISISIIDVLSNYFYLSYLKDEATFNSFASINQGLFFISEIIAVVFFYKKIIEKKTYWKKTLVIFLLSFILTLLFIYFNQIPDTNLIFSFTIIFELIFINYSFGYLFYSTIEKNFTDELKNLNYINYGFFVFVNLTAPFYFISVHLIKQNIPNDSLDFINYLGYTILYSTFIKSIKCRNQILSHQ